MKRIIIALMGLFALAASTRSSHAQVPFLGLVACDDCTAPAQLPAANLFGFRIDPSRPDQVDVLFDETRTGGGQIGGAAAPAPGSPLWSLPPNWRVFQRATDRIVAIVLTEGSLHFDSTDVFTQDMAANLGLPICSAPGAMAPLVRAVGADSVVEWQPVIELNDSPITDGCTSGGAEVRGFVIGYNVYRLSVATFPNPTRRDFVVSGYRAHADVARLNFNVVDPDGLSGSDLDPADGLRLRNPDGMPDTGDEVLMFTDVGAAATASWYRMQPVVRGPQSFFDTGLSSNAGVPADRLDLDSSGSPESVDIARDGVVEFIDPSGRGLGLTWAGEIASSYRAGLGVPLTERPACDGLPPAQTESECANGSDDDGDTLVDCFDIVDCCASAACSAIPPEIARVNAAKQGIGMDAITLTWLTAAPSPPGTVFDVLSGCLCRKRSVPEPNAPGCLWQDRGHIAAACLSDDQVALSLPDARAIDPTSMGFYYLVREQSICDVAGTWGRDSLGREPIIGGADCLP